MLIVMCVAVGLEPIVKDSKMNGRTVHSHVPKLMLHTDRREVY